MHNLVCILMTDATCVPGTCFSHFWLERQRTVEYRVSNVCGLRSGGARRLRHGVNNSGDDDRLASQIAALNRLLLKQKHLRQGQGGTRETGKTACRLCSSSRVPMYPVPCLMAPVHLPGLHALCCILFCRVLFTSQESLCVLAKKHRG